MVATSAAPGLDFRWLHRSRLGVTAVVLGTALTVAVSREDAGQMTGLSTVGFAVAGLSALYEELERKRTRRRRLAVAEILGDLILAAAVVVLTGGVSGPFVLLFPLVAFAGGLLVGPVGGGVTGIGAALLFQGLTLWGGSGPQVPAAADGGTLLKALYPMFFVAVGILAGFLGRRLRASEEALAQATWQVERLRLDTEHIVQNLSSGLFTVDRDGRVVHFNGVAEGLLGLRADAVRGRPLEEALAEGPTELVSRVLETLEQEIPLMRAEFRLQREEEVRPLGVSTSLLRDGDGRKTGVVVLFQDLTEIRRLERASRRQDRLTTVGEMAATIAHEVRNCVNPISGSVELLQQELKLSGENARLLELIGREAAQMERFVSELLNFTRGAPINLQDVSLESILEETLDRLTRHPAYRPTVALRRSYAQGSTAVRVDPEQLGQVFFNLALNALESMGPVGSLTVSIAPGPAGAEEWVAEFADTGSGMSRETLDRIFEPFYTTKGSGTGLGLALAHRIVERHHGRMEVTSRPGSGTRVRVSLPAGGAGSSAVENGTPRNTALAA